MCTIVHSVCILCICVHLCMHINAQLCTIEHMFTEAHICTNTHIYAQVCILAYVHCMHIYAYVHVCTYVWCNHIRGHPFMTSTQKGVRLRWTHVDEGIKPHVDVHTEN